MRKNRNLIALAISLIAFIVACGGNNISETLVGYVNPGDPQLGEPSEYAGSHSCKDCHLVKYESWRGTLHNMSVRDADQRGLTGKGIVADANDNGTDDFKDGLDLGGDDSSSEFHRYGANAPVLGYDSGAGKYTMTIGEVSYNVDRVYGGNGIFSQVYMTKIGKCYYILPVRYNEASKTYSLFMGDNWYDESDSPIYDTAGKTPVSAGRAYDSFERMCAGCHNTGIFIWYDNATGEYLTGYVELNTGCETCHGAGRSHNDKGGGVGVDTLNPKDLADGSVSGLKRANEVCGSCHIRGESAAATAGPVSKNRLLFPAYDDASGDILGYPLGGVLSDYITPTSDPGDYWGYDSSDGSFITSRSNYQQFLDLNNGAHSPGAGGDPSSLPTCFTCHDPHGSDNKADLVSSLTVSGQTVNVSADDNTLCLACHAGREPFENISTNDVAAVTNEDSYDNIKTEVIKHTKHPYSPDEFHTSNCIECHMFKTAGSADEYDIRSHTFNVISPHSSDNMADLGMTPVPHPCSDCHTDTDDYGAQKYDILVEYTGDNAAIHESHEQDAVWRNTYHILYVTLKGDSECQECHMRNVETVLPQANPGCTQYCHGI